jgi:hypothetical protein
MAVLENTILFSVLRITLSHKMKQENSPVFLSTIKVLYILKNKRNFPATFPFVSTGPGFVQKARILQKYKRFIRIHT